MFTGTKESLNKVALSQGLKIVKKTVSDIEETIFFFSLL